MRVTAVKTRALLAQAAPMKRHHFTIAKRLERLINTEQGMQAYMVRSGDYYVKLNNRSTKARKRKADF